jgi:hypothetical protein
MVLCGAMKCLIRKDSCHSFSRLNSYYLTFDIVNPLIVP